MLLFTKLPRQTALVSPIPSMVLILVSSRLILRQALYGCWKRLNLANVKVMTSLFVQRISSVIFLIEESVLQLKILLEHSGRKVVTVLILLHLKVLHPLLMPSRSGIPSTASFLMQQAVFGMLSLLSKQMLAIACFK